jgi:hypothetical protein
MTDTTTFAADSALAADEKLAKRLDGPPEIDLAKHLQAAVRAGSRASAIVSEIWRLGRGPGKISHHEYFYYRLYDGALDFADKLTFVGKKAQGRMHRTCNDSTWFSLVHDKLQFQATMEGLGLPTPRLLALYHPFRNPGQARALRSESDLEGFLRDAAVYPVFAKPVDGMYSLGCWSLEEFSAEDDTLVSSDGSRVGLDAFRRYLEGRGSRGYLFQERLRPHPMLSEAWGDRLTTIRIFTLVSERGPEIFRTVCKVCANGNIADNFWRAGNILGAIDRDNGTILRAVSGTGDDQLERPEHPDTGRPIVGLQLPDWQATLDLCLAAASALPAIRTQSWDIALTSEGPVLVEANFGGDLNLPQIAFGAGCLDERYRDHLRACGYKV